MKVLDVGSGAGDMVLLLAELVGQVGTVVGIEMNPGPLQIAHQRVLAAGLSQCGLLRGISTQ